MTTMVVRPLRSTFRRALRACAGDALVISPFLSLRNPAELSRALTRPSRLRVLTDMSAEHFASGASDICTVLALAQSGAEVRSVSGLHAKVYVLGDKTIVGSANCTERGLRSDLELGVLLADGPAVAHIRHCTAEWWNAAERWPVARIAQLAKVVTVTKRLRSGGTLAVDDDVERLQFVYIPKNAREKRLLFECVDLCDEPLTPVQVARDKGVHHETIRDMLDLAAYMGLLEKRGIAPGEARQTTFQQNRAGRRIASLVLDGDQHAVPMLQERLLGYGLPNRAVNVWRYPKYMQCSVRPWVTLLRCLAMVESDGAPGRGWGGRDLALIVLSVFHETWSEYERAADQLRATRGMPKSEAMKWRQSSSAGGASSPTTSGARDSLA